ncbi:MAG TPA: CBS domain-containing protein [Epsilonproteobacteria bacterium]|nr:CBS domain-containing protein [Campylobacterota bacterium]
MLVEEIMTPVERLIMIPQMSSVRDALQKMKIGRVRSLVVEKNGANGAYGLVTFKNILQSIVAEDGDIDLLNVYDIAALPSLSVSAKLDVKYAARMMVQRSIKRLLVIDYNELHGMLTMTDIITVLKDEVEN